MNRIPSHLTKLLIQRQNVWKQFKTLENDAIAQLNQNKIYGYRVTYTDLFKKNHSPKNHIKYFIDINDAQRFIDEKDDFNKYHYSVYNENKYDNFQLNKTDDIPNTLKHQFFLDLKLKMHNEQF